MGEQKIFRRFAPNFIKQMFAHAPRPETLLAPMVQWLIQRAMHTSDIYTYRPPTRRLKKIASSVLRPGLVPLRPGHTAFRVLTVSESRPKNGTREADAVKREEDAMKT